MSIVIPVYNGARYLCATLNSIKEQTFTDFETILVDDGSTDTTAEILRRYDTVRVLTTSHRGIVAALNAGIAAATSDLIVRIDADDLMAPSRLERQFAYIAAHPELGGAGSYYRIIDENGTVRGSKEPTLRSLSELNDYIVNGGNPIFPHPTMIFRKSVVLSVGGYREEFRKSEDVDLFIRMIQAGQPILIQPEYLTYFRYHTTSETANSLRTQYHLNQLIFGNFRRRLAGTEEISLDEYYKSVMELSPTAKLALEAKILSSLLLRRRDMSLLSGHHVTGNALLVAAAILNPNATALKLKRMIASRGAARHNFVDGKQREQ